MQIEFLWIIPIFSFAVFIFLVIYFAQKKTLKSDLSKEVTNFNNGIALAPVKRKNPDHRLEELERSISLVTHSIANQQKTIDRFKKENTEYNAEINELKNKLRELYKEYDIVLSENYSLRAKMKKMIEQKKIEEGNGPELPLVPMSDENDSSIFLDQGKKQNDAKVNLKLYEDTRLLNLNSLEENSEFDYSKKHPQ